MNTKLKNFNKAQLKKKSPDIRPGDTVKVYLKIKERGKERTQVFKGLVLAKKHGKGISSTITVRKVVSGIGVERIFPIHSPIIEKIEILKRGKVRRAKLYYLRKAKGRKARLKRVDLKKAVTEEKPTKEESPEEKSEKKKTTETKK
jgi:large subunit ribosomal protein L19